MIKELFAKRRLEFRTQSAKYLKYVFNDHFVLVMMFLLGAGFYQYSQLLKDFPKDSMWLQVIAVLILFVVTSFGRIGLFLEEADKVFLLPKEAEVLEVLKGAKQSSHLFGSLIQVGSYLLVYPLLAAAGWSIWALLTLLALLLFVRFIRIEREFACFVAQRMDWDKAIAYEKTRQQRMLSFFALFTTVKGMVHPIKPRPYLNPLLNRLPKSGDQVWLHLFARAYVRSGDYLSLTLRLFILSILLRLSLGQSLISVALVGLFFYLLLFQLMGVYKTYDYQLMARLYPVSPKLKTKGFHCLMRGILYPLMLIQILSYLPGIESLYLSVFAFLLLEGYLPHKIKSLVD